MTFPVAPRKIPSGRVRIVLITAVALLGACLALFTYLDTRPKTWPSLDVAVIGDDDLMFNTATITERPAVVNFWASWCIACRTEHAQLADLSGDPGLRVFGVNHRDSREDAERWLGFYGDPFELSIFDADGRIAEQLEITALPVTLVIDSGGRIRYRHDGALDTVTAETIIKPLMQELRRDD